MEEMVLVKDFRMDLVSLKNKIFRILQWIIVSFFILVAVSAVAGSAPLVVLFSIVVAFLISPFSSKLYARFPKLNHQHKIIIVVSSLIVWFLSFLSIPNVADNNSKSSSLGGDELSPIADQTIALSAQKPVIDSAVVPATDIPDRETVVIKRVVDGDTVELGDGRKLRYIGIDTPEAVDLNRPVGCLGGEASSKNKELVEGKTVTLEKDVSETDRYGRLLRYVYLDEVMINEVLVYEGYAKASTYPPDVKYQERLRIAETNARDNKRGLWSEACTDVTTPVSSPNQNSQANPDLPQSEICPKNCTEAREMGMGGMTRDHNCYKSSLDRDNDGIACDK
jgi:micrococcal nuclease